MAASQDECVAQFPRQAVCNDRLYSRLLSWSGYITALPMPPTDTAPDIEWVKQRLYAERLPSQAYNTLLYVSPYVVQVPQITQKIRSHLNAWNDETTETDLVADIDSALAVVMPKVAVTMVSDQDVANWCDANGYPLPPDLGTGPATMAIPLMPPMPR
jgi:hypothetical protein